MHNSHNKGHTSKVHSSSSFFFFSLFFHQYIYFFTLKMTIAPVSVTVNNNSPIQDYVHPDDHIQPTYESSYRKVCNWTTN